MLIVWLPILFTLSSSPTGAREGIGVLVLTAFGMRLYVFDGSLRARLDGAEARAPSRRPERLYFVAFTAIAVLLYSKLPDAKWLASGASLSARR